MNLDKKNTSNRWTEDDSQLYWQIAPVAVPHRAEQMAILLSLLPFSRHESFQAVEVGCGQGILSQALLTCFSRANVIALDGSTEMRMQTAKRLREFSARARVEPFELAATAWHPYLQNADCVLSSLVVHHLSGRGKRELFKSIHDHLSARGVLLIADLIAPQRPEARSLFAITWDRAARTQALAQTNSVTLFEKFKQAKWNYFHFKDPADWPSPLFDQLLWIKEAGFAVVDCFWLQAGHAIYGGYKSAAGGDAEGVSFEEALQLVDKLLQK